MTTLSHWKIYLQKQYSLSASCLALAFTFTGCGGSPTETAPSTPAASATVSTPAVASTDEALVEQTVNEFMSALKSGNRQKVESLMTPTSITEIKKTPITVNPLGGDKMQFTIMSKQILQMPGKLGAHVLCEISDVNDDGQVEKHNHLWALRKETDGWRIAGMAAEMFPGETPVLFDFENAEDMVHQLKQISAEMERRQAASAGVHNNAAQQPGQSVSSPLPPSAVPQTPPGAEPRGTPPVLTAQQPMNPGQPTFIPQQSSAPNGQQPAVPTQPIPSGTP